MVMGSFRSFDLGAGAGGDDPCAARCEIVKCTTLLGSITSKLEPLLLAEMKHQRELEPRPNRGTPAPAYTGVSVPVSSHGVLMDSLT